MSIIKNLISNIDDMDNRSISRDTINNFQIRSANDDKNNKNNNSISYKTKRTNNKKNKKTVDIVIPVYNEEKALEDSVKRLNEFLSENLQKFDCRIVIADNASKDNTQNIAKKLEQDGICKYLFIPRKGRGYALKEAWMKSNADIVTYMDVDLSTELEALPKLINALATRYDIGTGSRLHKESKTKRSFKREFISRTYNLIIKSLFWTNFTDAQCGFKGATRRAVNELVPLIKDNEWFFDTELLILAERKGYKIFDFPVKWIEDIDSKVQLINDIIKFIKNLLAFRWRLWVNERRDNRG